jgi:peroxiredoxin Q/BCP
MLDWKRAASSLVSTVLRPDALLGAGSEAPSFDLLSSQGGRVRSEELKGRNYVLIFYPGDDTPGCTLQLQAFTRLKDRFAEHDCDIFGVNAADVGSHQRFVTKCALGVPLLVDEGRRLAVAFRTAREGVPRTFRAVFVVDKKGIVRTAMKDFPDPEAILRLVERSEETGYKGTGRKGRQLVPDISTVAIERMRTDDPSTVVVDLRDPPDWVAGHVPGAINIPIEHLIQRMAELPAKDTPVVLVCDQGLRAPGAGRMLSDSGWRKLFTLTDGMGAWKGTVERGAGPT